MNGVAPWLRPRERNRCESRPSNDHCRLLPWKPCRGGSGRSVGSSRMDGAPASRPRQKASSAARTAPVSRPRCQSA